MIRFACPICTARIAAPSDKIGAKAPCPQCGRQVLVPDPARNKAVSREQPPAGAELAQTSETIKNKTTGPRHYWPWFVGGTAIILLLATVAILLLASQSKRRHSASVARIEKKAPASEEPLAKSPAVTALPKEPSGNDRVRPIPRGNPLANQSAKEGASSESMTLEPGQRFMLPLKVLGDEERLNRVKVTRMEWNGRTFTGAGGPGTLAWRDSNKWRWEQDFPSANIYTLVDGDQGWMWPSKKGIAWIPGVLGNAKNCEDLRQGKVIDLQGQELAEVKTRIMALGLSDLVSLQRIAKEFVVEERVKNKGRSFVGVKATNPELSDIRLYFDEESQLLARATIRGQDGIWEMNFTDYKETDGIKHWTKAERVHDGKWYGTFDLQKIQFFDEVDEKLFAKP